MKKPKPLSPSSSSKGGSPLKERELFFLSNLADSALHPLLEKRAAKSTEEMRDDQEYLRSLGRSLAESYSRSPFSPSLPLSPLQAFHEILDCFMMSHSSRKGFKITKEKGGYCLKGPAELCLYSLSCHQNSSTSPPLCYLRLIGEGALWALSGENFLSCLIESPVKKSHCKIFFQPTSLPQKSEDRFYRSTTSLPQISSMADKREREIRDLKRKIEKLKGALLEEKKQRDFQLRQNKMESVALLAGGMAHAFNNILTGVIGNLSLAKSRAVDKKQLSAILEEAQEATYRAKALTQQLLTFSKGGDPVKKRVSFSGFLRGAVDSALYGTKVSCLYSIPEDPFMVWMDSGQIQQAIHNVVKNAIQAMGEEGLLKVKVVLKKIPPSNPFSLKKGEYLQVFFDDEGSGIGPNHLSKIFDPYFTTKQMGSGLGLAITHSIIHKHGGTVFAEPKNPRGTLLSFYLPLATDEEETTKELKDRFFPPLSKRPKEAKEKILIMDDEELIRKLAGRILSYYGYLIDYAPSGEVAIAKYKEARNSGAPFDLVIMDLTIPNGMGGKETIERLKRIDPSIRAIVSSGYSNDPVMANYEEYGFQGIVPKPYTPEDLLLAVEKLLP